MMKSTKLLLPVLLCSLARVGAADAPAKGLNFASDLALLKAHASVIVLADPTGKEQVAVVPQYQGRVMTSTGSGAAGDSYGWLNRKLIASGKTEAHINAYGGEDRIWFGPEGGQFGLFFKPGVPYDFPHWQTPAPIDTQNWAVTRKSRQAVSFKTTVSLVNHSGTHFRFTVDREVRLVSPGSISAMLDQKLPANISAVGYETDNKITNSGPMAWSKKSGLISIWVLGQYNPSASGAIVIPFKTGPVSARGPIANDAYFGKVAPDRLRTDEARGVLFFKDDGKKRGKIGIGPNRVVNTLGSYDPDRHILTIVRFNLPPAVGSLPYVNSMWENQKAPFGGDVANSYNVGPLDTGGQLGPFYELETSSPGGELAPGASLDHRRTTLHLQGPAAGLDPISVKVLGVHLKDITTSPGA
jgi:hypothetical protein